MARKASASKTPKARVGSQMNPQQPAGMIQAIGARDFLALPPDLQAAYVGGLIDGMAFMTYAYAPAEYPTWISCVCRTTLGDTTNEVVDFIRQTPSFNESVASAFAQTIGRRLNDGYALPVPRVVELAKPIDELATGNGGLSGSEALRWLIEPGSIAEDLLVGNAKAASQKALHIFADMGHRLDALENGRKEWLEEKSADCANIERQIAMQALLCANHAFKAAGFRTNVFIRLQQALFSISTGRAVPAIFRTPQRFANRPRPSHIIDEMKATIAAAVHQRISGPDKQNVPDAARAVANNIPPPVAFHIWKKKGISSDVIENLYREHRSPRKKKQETSAVRHFREMCGWSFTANEVDYLLYAAVLAEELPADFA